MVVRKRPVFVVDHRDRRNGRAVRRHRRHREEGLFENVARRFDRVDRTPPADAENHVRFAAARRLENAVDGRIRRVFAVDEPIRHRHPRLFKPRAQARTGLLQRGRAADDGGLAPVEARNELEVVEHIGPHAVVGESNGVRIHRESPSGFRRRGGRSKVVPTRKKRRKFFDCRGRPCRAIGASPPICAPFARIRCAAGGSS